MAMTPVYNWPLPDLPQPANAPGNFTALGTAIESTIADQTLLAYYPKWTAVGNYQPSSPQTIIGKYRLERGYCDVYAYIGFGPATSGGSEALHVGLPAPGYASLVDQTIPCRLFLPTLGTVLGSALISGGATFAAPLFPLTLSTAVMGWWASVSNAIAPGSGVPSVPGDNSMPSGGWFVMNGRYRST